MRRRDTQGVARRRDRESGQAMVEFALILFPLLLLVAGIIQFGIGLHYWHDTNRIANQGARFAVVNAWPGCDRTAAAGACADTSWKSTLNCAGSPPAGTSLKTYLECQALTQGLRNSAQVNICYANDLDTTNDGLQGTPVRVTVDTDWTFAPIVELGTISLVGRATMRLEQVTDPARPAPARGHLSGVTACPT